MNTVSNERRQINQKFMKFSQFATFSGKRVIYFDVLVCYSRFNKKYVKQWRSSNYTVSHLRSKNSNI